MPEGEEIKFKSLENLSSEIIVGDSFGGGRDTGI
jgi:hypothetical protein